MYRLILCLMAVLGCAPAMAQTFPSPTFLNLTVNGAAALNNGSIAGTFTGGTLSGTTISGSTFTGGTLSGTIAGTPTLSGSWDFQGTTVVGSNTTAQILRLNGAAGSARALEWASAGVKRYHIQPNGSDNLQMLAYDSGGLNPVTVWTITNTTGAFTFGSAPVTVPFFENVGAGTITYSGSDFGTCGTSQPFCANMAFAGSTTTAVVSALNRFFVSSDNLATPNASGGADQFRFDMNFGGAAINGGRRAVNITFTDTADMPAQNNTAGFVAFQPKIDVSHNAGTGQFPYAEAMNPTCSIEATAVNWVGCTVIESDMFVVAGATQPLVKVFQFWHITPSDAQQATQDDTFLLADAAPSTGVSNTVATMHSLFKVMKTGASQWPMDATAGEFLTIGEQEQTNGSSVAVRPNAMARGLNFSKINFTDAAMWWPGGWLGADGTTRLGRLQISLGTTGPAIDASLYKATACGVSVGGTKYTANDQVYASGLAGVIQIDTVDGSGAVLTCSWLKPAYSTTNPATASTTGGTGPSQAGTRFTASITWALATEIQLGASVNTIIGTGSALATNATSGFVQLATMAGAPTGTIGAAGKAAVVIDTTNKKICYSTGGGTWECSGAFTP